MRASVGSLSDCGCGGACSKHGFTIDTPVMSGAGTALPVTKAMGHVMGIKGLADAQPNANAGPIISRASNVASLTTAMLLQLPPDRREPTLSSIGGFNWATDVLRVAQNNPDKSSPTRNIRNSLGLHFLLGVIDAENRKDTANARAYLAFARLFKDAQNRRNAQPAVKPSGLSGLGSLGWAPTDTSEMGADHRWCDANAGKEFPASELAACKRCPNPGGSWNSPKNSYNYADWYGRWECRKEPPSMVEGRRARGMTATYVPPVTYPAPTDRASVDLSRFQVANCGPFGVDQDRTEKRNNVTRLFTAVFNRAPNNAEIQYYGEMKWCATNASTMDSSMASTMVNVRTAIIEKRANTTTPTPMDGGVVPTSVFAIRTTGGDIVASAQKAAEQAFSFVGKAADFVINVVCDGFKQVFGPVVGGALCQVATLLLNSLASMYQALIVIVQEAFTGIMDSLKAMAAGQWQEAMMALLRAVGRMLFALSAPISVPLLMGTQPGVTREQAFADLRAKADRVTKKNPLFPVTLVIALVQLSAGPSLPVISGITLSISPMIAVFVAPPLLSNTAVQQLAGIATLEAMETAIENIIKMVLVIVQGLMKLPDILPKLKGQLQAAAQRKLGRGAAGVLELVTNSVRAFEAGFNALNLAVQKFQFQQITAAAVQLLNAVPLMLAAFVGPEDMAAGAVPSITDWMNANEAAGRTVDEQQAALREASLTFLRRLPFPQAMLVLVDTTMQAQDLGERAKLVAQVVGQTRKQNRAGFDSFFVPAFKAELLKV